MQYIHTNLNPNSKHPDKSPAMRKLRPSEWSMDLVWVPSVKVASSSDHRYVFWQVYPLLSAVPYILCNCHVIVIIENSISISQEHHPMASSR